MPRSVILFDLDGTLVDSARDIAAALTRLSLARGGPEISVGAVRPLVSLGAAALVSRALGPLAGDPQADVALFRHLLREVPSDPKIVFPSVENALERLTDDGWRLGIVTNKPESLATALLQTHRLNRFFTVVVGGDSAAQAKPDPAPVNHALQALGVAARHALFVGDSHVDAQAAASLDIPLLLYAAGYGACDVEDHVADRFASYDDLPMIAAGFR